MKDQQTTKAQNELREATAKLGSYLELVASGVATFDANHKALTQAEDAIRQAKFQARGAMIATEGASQ